MRELVPEAMYVDHEDPDTVVLHGKDKETYLVHKDVIYLMWVLVK